MSSTKSPGSIFSDIKQRVRSMTSSKSRKEEDDRKFLARIPKVVDELIRLGGKSTLTYRDVKSKLVVEFSNATFERNKEHVQQVLAKVTAPSRSRRKPGTANASTLPQAARPGDRGVLYSNDIRQVMTTDQATLRYDMNGAMSKTLNDNDMELLSKQLHSSWPSNASELKAKPAAAEMREQRNGVLTDLPGDGQGGSGLRDALAAARTDNRVKQILAFRRASTYGTPGQNMDGLGARPPPRSHHAVPPAPPRTMSPMDPTGTFVLPASPKDMEQGGRASRAGSTTNAWAKKPRTTTATSSLRRNSTGTLPTETVSISERAARLHQISFLKRKGVISDMQKSVAKELLLNGDRGIIQALQSAEKSPLKFVSYLALRMGQPGIEAVAHYRSQQRRLHQQPGGGAVAAAQDTKLTPTGKAKRRRSSKEGTVGTKLQPRKWTVEEDKALIGAVKSMGAKNWKEIATRVEGRNHVQCLQRYKKVLKPGLVRGGWTDEEDELLKRLIFEEMGRLGVVIEDVHKPVAVRAAWLRNWGAISDHVPGRTPKQCRERWINHMDPSIKKGEWSNAEDVLIIKKQAELGNKWSLISKMLPGRTENAVKIRHKSLLRAAAKRTKKADDQKRRAAAQKKQTRAKAKAPKAKAPKAKARKAKARKAKAQKSAGKRDSGSSSFNIDLYGDPLFVGGEEEDFVFDQGEGRVRNSWEIGEAGAEGRRSWDDMFSEMPGAANDEKLRRLSTHSLKGITPRNSLETMGASPMIVEEETVSLRDSFIIGGDNGTFEPEEFDIQEVFDDDDDDL